MDTVDSDNREPTGAFEGTTQTDPAATRGAGGEQVQRGTRIDRYIVVDQLGAGGMGAVYKAYDPELGRLVAVKLVRVRPATPRHSARLLREGQAIAQLSHPNIIAVYDAGLHAGDLFIAMEYVAGVPLSVWLREPRGSLRELLELFLQAAQGLAAAHARGIIHRDFKPDNLLVGEDGRARVADFGLAYSADDVIGSPPAGQPSPAADPTITAPGTIVGTPSYMAPEQHRSAAVDARADQFAYCATLYEAIAGQRALPGSTRGELADAATNGSVRPFPSDCPAPQWLRDLIERGLQADPEHRFESMQQIIDEFTRDREAVRRASYDGSTTTDAMLAAFPPPEDVKIRLQVESLRHDLEQAWQLKAAGAYRESLEIARRVEGEARVLGYRPLDAAASYLVGNLLHRVGESEPGRQVLYHAARAAAAAGDDWQVANIWIQLVAVVGAGMGRFQEAEALVQVARAAVARVGENASLQSRLFNNHGLNLHAEGRLDEAMRSFQRSIECDVQTHGAEHPLVAIPLTNLGQVLLTAGVLEHARVCLERAVTIREQHFGVEHPYLTRSVAGLAQVALAAGRHAEARPLFERALDLWKSAASHDHRQAVELLTGHAECSLALGEPEVALPQLDRSRRLCDTLGLDPAQEAPTWFCLARALWARGGPDDQQRARSLAVRARAAFAKVDDRRCEQVVEWLISRAEPAD